MRYNSNSLIHNSVIALVLVCTNAGVCASGEQILKKETVRINENTLVVEIADTQSAHMKGLMYRTDLKEDEGMLFIYSTPQKLTYWMKNTPLPLDLMYIDEDFRIVQIEYMQPFDTRGHRSKMPVLFVLEVNRGWCDRHGVKVGDTITRIGDFHS